MENSNKYLYADILIALAHVDGEFAQSERDLLDDIFKQMELDPEKLETMWMTPRSRDVVEAILKDIIDERFKRCLLKDCYLLAYADGKIRPEESKFIIDVCTILNLDSDTVMDIHNWVQTAIIQQEKAYKLFKA